MDLLYTKYTRALISYDGVYRVETFPVPRKAVIDAIIHRDYASPTTTPTIIEDGSGCRLGVLLQKFDDVLGKVLEIV